MSQVSVGTCNTQVNGEMGGFLVVTEKVSKLGQVSGFLGGEREYGNLKGDTGPLVYPAGFLYVYSAVQSVTGGQVYPAQVLCVLSFDSPLCRLVTTEY